MAQYLLFADTNVFLDAFLQRKAGRDCKQILILAEKAVVKLYTSPSCLLTVIYFLQKSGMPAKVIRESIADLLKLLSLKSPDEKDFLTSLNAGFPDLEDAVQYQTALQIKGIGYFITSNIKDFKKASKQLPVATPMQFIDLIKK
jgi:predicted nucleic acid-binding protein